MAPRIPLQIVFVVAAVLLWRNFGSIKTALTANLTGSQSLSGWILLASVGLLVVGAISNSFQAHLKFFWHAFIAPIGSAEQRERLDKFYKGQAEIYDKTRNGLLRGRKTMLSLSIAHLKQLRVSNATDRPKRLVWVDVGGGTGFNIEAMDAIHPIAEFDAVYLVDLCEPLLDIARRRFARKGWTNVHCICADAASFVLPEPEWAEGCDPRGSISFISFSYSLSMIPNFYPVLDRISYLLSPTAGLLAVVDFYTSGRASQQTLHERAIGGPEKECGWLSRWFWQIWFDFDHIFLGPQRRDYLEYKFGTIKSYNGRNRFVLPFIIRIPYYIWLGRSRSCDVSRFLHAFEVESGNTIGNLTPRNAIGPSKSNNSSSSSTTLVSRASSAVSLSQDALTTKSSDGNGSEMPELEIGEAAIPVGSMKSHNSAALGTITSDGGVVIDIFPPLSSFHYQVKNPWRLPYYEQPVHKEFRSFIYSFTWEDPMEDMRHLQLSRDDTMFVITSAGDNALHYAIEAQPKRIHCVDINPCQGHLFELKLAAIQALSYSEFFDTFGEGKQQAFRRLLDTKLSPLLSSICYQFWRINSYMFTTQPDPAMSFSKYLSNLIVPCDSFYLRGYSGWALHIARMVFSIFGVADDVRRLCDANTIAEQNEIWETKIRPVLLNPVVVALLKNPVFCWNALGVPLNQRRMFLNEGTAFEYARDTLDPIPKTALLKDGAYHYLLTLLGKYTPKSCPRYLTRDGFEKLRENNSAAMNAFRLHTDSIINVLRGLPDWSLTRAVIMDHLDWFAPGSDEAETEIGQFYRALAPGGFVLLRSAAKEPWYMDMFSRAGFVVTRLSVREGNQVAIDRVNMYASLWKAHKP